MLQTARPLTRPPPANLGSNPAEMLGDSDALQENMAGSGTENGSSQVHRGWVFS